MARSVNVTITDPSKGLQILLTGNWRRLDSLGEDIRAAIQRGYQKASLDFANKLLRIVKKSLATGTPPPGVTWEPLSPATIKRWGQHPIYNLTGLYSRSVGLYQYKSRVLVGLPINNKRSSQRALTLNQLAKILEFGTADGRIPARPLWAPSLKAVGDKSALKKTILLYIRRELAKYGIKPNQVKW